MEQIIQIIICRPSTGAIRKTGLLQNEKTTMKKREKPTSGQIAGGDKPTTSRPQQESDAEEEERGAEGGLTSNLPTIAIRHSSDSEPNVGLERQEVILK